MRGSVRPQPPSEIDAEAAGKNGAAPSQSQRTPPAVNECSGASGDIPPTEPNHDKHNRRNRQRTERRQHGVRRADRERPSPWWISASPAAASGISIMQSRHSTRVHRCSFFCIAV